MLMTGAIVWLLLAGELLGRRMICRAYDAQLYVMTAEVLKGYVERVEAQLERMDELTLSVIGDQSIQDGLAQIAAEPTGSARWLLLRAALGEALDAHRYDGMNLQQFCLRVRPDTYIAVKSGFGEPEELLHERALEEKGRLCFVVNEGSLYLAREIRKTHDLSLEHMGTILARVDVKELIKRCTMGQSDLGVAVWVEGECLYDTTGLSDAWPEAAGGQVVGDRFVVSQQSRRGWRFLVSMPYGGIQRSLGEAARGSLLLALAACALGLMISALLTRSISRHLARLLAKFDAYQAGRLPEDVDSAQYVHRRDEIGRLHRHFDRMAREHKRLTDENYEHMVLLKEAQYGQLQQQIRPHFLFNTLSAIVWSAYAQGDEQTARMTETLARILRASINRGEATVTLREELQLTEDYLEIQRARFGERLEYSCEAEEALMETALPRMSIQPLVENSIRYAAEEMLETCVIRIRTMREGGDVLILVEDNGPGMDEDILHRLEEGTTQSQGTGIGLRNIDKRVKIAFSERYGLEFRRKQAVTQVCLRVPGRSEERKGEDKCTR